MSLKIRLESGDELSVLVDPTEWEQAFREALAKDQMLELTDEARGRKLTINPALVEYYYLEAEPGEQPDDADRPMEALA